jgi:sensor histidine kinase YesM
MRQLKIDLSELEMAFDSYGEMISYYLDLETGEVISVSDEEGGLLESIYQSYYDEQSETVDWESAFEKEQISDWQRELLKNADRIEAGFGNRFISIPSEGSHESYCDMEAFIATVHNLRLQERLERAISGRGAFRYFKDVLLDYPAERERWFQFKRERLRQRILDWLEAHEITPLE